jgi:cob(I)alamin adenosyltransferase
MAIRITRVYTRTGDGGRTRLVGGKEVPKDARRIEAYGTLDELNAVLGLARTFNEADVATHPASARLDTILRRLQNEIFDLGSELATPPDATYDGMYRVGAEDVTRLEHLIDECQKDLEPLASFILPGGGRVAAFLHQARTVCRRTEREIVRLGREEVVGEWPVKYVNRLSDLLFVLARWLGHQRGEPEYLWERGLNPRGASGSGSSAGHRPGERDKGD